MGWEQLTRVSGQHRLDSKVNIEDTYLILLQGICNLGGQLSRQEETQTTPKSQLPAYYPVDVHVYGGLFVSGKIRRKVVKDKLRGLSIRVEGSAAGRRMTWGQCMASSGGILEHNTQTCTATIQARSDNLLSAFAACQCSKP